MILNLELSVSVCSLIRANSREEAFGQNVSKGATTAQPELIVAKPRSKATL